MKKSAALILLAATWYFAGMNRQPYVMSAAVCGMLFVVLMFIISRVLSHDLTLKIPPQDNIVYKDSEAEITVKAENNGNLPVNKYSVWVSMKYRGEKRGSRRRLNGRASGRNKNEENIASIYFNSPYSGIIDCRLTKMRVYDFLMIFSSAKKLKNVCEEVVVLPPPRRMNIQMPPFGSYTNEPVAESSSDKRGEDHSEIRQIREYQQGDLIRHLHRNYSARTEKLWVKEYQKENDFIFDMIIDSSMDTQMDMIHMDAFFELLCSVIWNLMEHDVIIRVHYYDREKDGLVMFELSKKSDVEGALVRIIRSDIFCSSEKFYSVCSREKLDKAMVITASLGWSFCGSPVYAFNESNVIKELTERYFDLNTAAAAG